MKNVDFFIGNYYFFSFFNFLLRFIIEMRPAIQFYLLFSLLACLQGNLRAQDFEKFANVVDSEQSLEKLKQIVREEQEKFSQTKNRYYLYNVKYAESGICNMLHDHNGRLRKLTWITEDCSNCETEQMAWVNYHLASVLSLLDARGLAEEYGKKTLYLAHKKKVVKLYSLCYSLLGTNFYRQNEFEWAIKNYKNAIKHAEESDYLFRASMLNNIGLSYMKLNKNQLSYEYYKQSLQSMDQMEEMSTFDRHFEEVVKGNIGTILHKLGDYDRAQELLEHELSYYKNHPEFIFESIGPLVELLELYQQKGDQQNTAFTLQRIKELDQRKGGDLVLTEAIYTYYRKRNNPESMYYADRLVKKLKLYSDSVNKQTVELNEIVYQDKLKHLKSEADSQEKILRHAVTDKKKSQTISFIMVVLAVLVLVIGIIVRSEKGRRAKKDLVISEQRKQIEQNERIILENEIQQQQDRITNLAMNLTLKKETERAFLLKIKEIRKRKNVDIEAVILDLQLCVTNLLEIDKKMLNSSIETDEINRKFKNLLAEMHPELNESDLNFCCYFRLNLSSKEIGSLHGLSDVSVRVLKNKIKKKIGLVGDVSVNKYLSELDIS